MEEIRDVSDVQDVEKRLDILRKWYYRPASLWRTWLLSGRSAPIRQHTFRFRSKDQVDELALLAWQRDYDAFGSHAREKKASIELAGGTLSGVSPPSHPAWPVNPPSSLSFRGGKRTFPLVQLPKRTSDGTQRNERAEMTKGRAEQFSQFFRMVFWQNRLRRIRK